MEGDCICQNPNKTLVNNHMNQRTDIELFILGKMEDKCIVISEHKGTALATFDIKYCPICGKKLW